MKYLSALILVLTSACAADPDSIKPAYVSQLTYAPYTCPQLGEEEVRLQNALSSVSTTQRQARSQDAWGVALIGLPVSSLSGSNVASQVAQVKGELEAVQGEAIRKNCSTSPQQLSKPVAWIDWSDQRRVKVEGC